MKKLALLLAALGVMSATTLAAEPTLKVTSIGQEIENENVSGGSDIEDVWLWNNLGLSYGDWAFNVQVGKAWSMDTDDGIHSANHRLQFDAMRKMNDNYSLGFRYRGQKDFDRYQLRGAWNYGMIWGSADVWYQANNASPAKEDNYEMELYPFGINYNGIKVGYLLNYKKWINPNEEYQKSFIEHQIRAYAPLYKGEKLTVQTEIRHTLHADKDYTRNKEGKKIAYSTYDDFGRTRIYLKNSYQVNESLNVYLNYGYEVRDYVARDGKANTKSDKYYGDLSIGWNYKF